MIHIVVKLFITKSGIGQTSIRRGKSRFIQYNTKIIVYPEILPDRTMFD